MDPPCDLCGVLRAVVYCNSDSARLCLPCNGSVHYANSLSRRHSRSLLCNRCCLKHAMVRCEDENLSLCQGCDGGGNGCSGPGHNRHPLDCYSGCPSKVEYACLWSSILDMNYLRDLDGGSELTGGVVKVVLENAAGNYSGCGRLTDLDHWTGQTTKFLQNLSYIPFCRDPAPFASPVFVLPKAPSSRANPIHIGIQGWRKTCQCPNLADPSTKTWRLTGTYPEQACSSSVIGNQFVLDHGKGLGFQTQSGKSLSLSNITGESSAADYQDCGLSPVFLGRESPWESLLEGSCCCPLARDKAKMRYNDEKKTRTFGKQMRYASRKARADARKRVKGRFVKAGVAYDYE